MYRNKVIKIDCYKQEILIHFKYVYLFLPGPNVSLFKNFQPNDCTLKFILEFGIIFACNNNITRTTKFF